MKPAQKHRAPLPRAWAYAFASAGYAMGAPLGYLLLQSLLTSAPVSLGWIAQELRSQPILYAYLASSTTTVFVLLGVRLGRKEDRLDALSMTDALTGLANRRGLDARLAEEFSRASRSHESLSLLVVDLDGLKTINDARGHSAGDVAICAVAQSLRSTCRLTDFAARSGGDEFVVLAPSTGAEEAVDLARRVQATLAGLSLEVSVSIGVADLRRSARSSSEALYAAADRALYTAKAEGRNCVRLAPPPGGFAEIALEPMKSPGADDEVVVQLPIRVRRTQYGQGEYTEVSSVGCPLVGGDVPLARCEKCERAGAVIGGEVEGRWQCRVPTAVLPNESPGQASLTEKLRRTKVSEVMTRSVTCVDTELDLDELSRIFQTMGLRGAPVVEDQGVLLGMVSHADLVRGRAAESQETEFPPGGVGLLVEDIMTGEVVRLRETSSLAEAVELLAAKNLHRVAVVSQDDVVVGILCLVDLARWIARQSPSSW